MSTTRNNRLTVAYLLAISILSMNACQDARQLEFGQYYGEGRALYEQHCQNCHAADGKGLGMLIPPLTDSVLLRKNRAKLPCIIRDGLSGFITVNGKTYSGEMPANKALTPIELAELATYITNSFGHKQGIYTLQEAERACK